MVQYNLSTIQQKQVLQQELINVRSFENFNWDDFSLSFQEIFEVVCCSLQENDLFKTEFLNSLVHKFGIPTDPLMHFNLVKEVIDVDHFDDIDSLYKLSLFDIECKKILLDLLLQKINKKYPIGILTIQHIEHIDFNLFGLSFKDVWEIVWEYPYVATILQRGHNYIKENLSANKISDLDKKLLLDIALLKIENEYIKTRSKVYIDLSIFELPFNDIWGVLSLHKKARSFTINQNNLYIKKYLRTASKTIKDDFIITAFQDGMGISSYECIFLDYSKEESVELFKKLIKANLENSLDRVAGEFFFGEIFPILMSILREEDEFYLLRELLNNYHRLDQQFFMQYFQGCRLSEESESVLGNLYKELKEIMPKEDDGMDNYIIELAKSLKSKVFNVGANKIWDERNKELFGKELKFLSEIREVTDGQSSFIFLRIADWLIYTVVLYNFLSDNNLELYNTIMQNQDVIIKTLKEIRSFSNNDMRFNLTKLLLENICNNTEAWNLYVELVKDANQVSFLPSLIFVSHSFSLSAVAADLDPSNKQFIIEILNKVKNNRKYKDGKYMRPLVVGLHTIFSQEKIMTLKERFELTNKVLDGKELNLQKNNWLLIEAIFSPAIINHPNFTEFYEDMMKENVDFNSIFQKICYSVFELKSQEGMSTYNESFGTKHNHTALLTYYTKMQSLPEPENTQMLEVFKQYFNSVLANGDQSYKKVRYLVSSNPQLRVIFDHHSDLKPKWEEGCSYDYQQFIEDYNLTNFVAKEFDLNSFITTIILQNHLPNEFCEKIKQYIDATQEDKQGIMQELVQEQHLLKQKENLEQNLQYKLNALELQLALMNAISTKYSSKEEKIKQLYYIMRVLNNLKIDSEFRENIIQAIKFLTKNRSKESTNYDGWKILDTDDYWSMFMAGTDIEGSCQKVDGDPNLNKCLMGYVMNGDYRMLAIQNTQGITVARCIIHLVWDEDQQVASLFMEDLYPFYITYIQEQALVQLAINRAKHLGVNLVSTKFQDPDLLDYYENTLRRAKGGIAHCVYSDATYSVEYDEIKIKKAKFLYNHDKILHIIKKKQELDAEAVKYGAIIYHQQGNGLFFSASQYATPTQPYGPYSDHLCCTTDPLTVLAVEYSQSLTTKLRFME